jgi:hypothetical protein
MSRGLTSPQAVRVLEAEFQSCFLMGLGFGMIAETSNGIDAFVGALFCAASLCLMLSARSLRETLADIA